VAQRHKLNVPGEVPALQGVLEFQQFVNCRFGLTGKLGLGCGSRSKRDGVPELFELSYEAFGASFWVTAGEVPGA
jgi:hypothetical protein